MSYISDGGGGGVLPPAVPTTFRTTAGDAIPALNILTLTNGANVTMSGAGSAVTIALSGTTNHAIQLGNVGGSLSSLAVGTTGKYLRATTAADPAWSTLTLPDTVLLGDVLVASANNVVGVVNDVVNAGYVLTANAAAAPTFQALPAAGIVSVSGTANQVTASTALGAVTLSTPATFIAPGTIASTTTNTAGTDFISTAGNLKLPTTSATVGQIQWNSIPYIHAYGGDGLGGAYDSNMFIGKYAGNFTMTTGANFGGNVGIGYKALFSTVSAGANLALGYKSLTLLQGSPGTSGNFNVALGNFAGSRLIGNSGVNYGAYFNLLAGYNAGYNLTASEYSNIYLNSDGNAGENGYLRIGMGTAADDAAVLSTKKIQKAFISGIYNKTVGATAGVVLSDSTDQLGGLAGAANTIFVGGTKPSFSASPTASGTITGNALAATTTVTAGTNLVSTAGYLDLPKVSSTKGYIRVNSNPILHNYDSGGFEESLYIGVGAGNFTTSQRYSCGVGTNALHAATGGGGQNLAFGSSCLSSLTSGAYNNAFGQGAGSAILTGSYNVFFGGYMGGAYSSQSYTSSESSNICIQNVGVTGESNTLRIGTSGSGNAQINRAFIAGIYGVTPAGTINVALVDSNGQFGSTATLPPSLGGAMTWTEVTGTSQAAVVNNGYITNNVALVTVTLPSTAAVGQRVAITGKGTGLWKLAQNSGQTIHYGSTDSTTGVSGYLAATVRYDCLEVQCTTANTDWVVIRSIGTISVV